MAEQPAPKGSSVASDWWGKLTLEPLARAVGVWIDSRFPNDSMLMRGLILGEEAGEVQRCILKATQQVRGGADYWDDQLPGELVDVLIAVLGIAHRADIDIEHAIRRRWAEVEQRAYPTGDSGGGVTSG